MKNVWDTFGSFTRKKDFLMYLLLFIGAAYILYIERTDIHCPRFTSTKQECDSEGGMAFSHTRPKDTDSIDILLNKIHKASGAEQASIKWRKSLLLSIGIMISVWLLVITPGKLPEWQQLYLGILVGFVIILGTHLYYSFHIFGTAEQWIKDAINLIKSKL
jgi:hypothetical protein